LTALLFDLDETLVVDEPAVVGAFAACAATTWLDAPALASAARRCARARFRAAPWWPWANDIGIASGEVLWAPLEHPSLAEIRAFAPAYRVGAWADALAEQGVADDALARSLADRFVDERRARMANYPEAEAVLTALAAQHSLALVTNGMSDLQRYKVEVSGLGRFFGAVIVSGDLGVGKPDPAVFAAALDALGASADGAVMVGDSLERDVAGALGAGLSAVWVDRAGRGGGPEGVPAIATLDELPALVG